MKVLPLKGNRKPNGHKERQGRQAFKRNIAEWKTDFPILKNEFNRLAGNTIVGVHPKSVVITLVERISKVITTLKIAGRQAADIGKVANQWFEAVLKKLFKPIAFNLGEKFSNWKSISNQNDSAVYFADPGTPS